MRGNYDVTEAEWDVLKMLWKQDGTVKASELLTYLQEDGKSWKRQTVNTFLARLEKKGFVKRQGRIVEAVIDEETFNTNMMKESVEHLYGGKIGNFIAAFARQNGLSKTEREEIKKILDDDFEE